jgi:hypothetical protein
MSIAFYWDMCMLYFGDKEVGAKRVVIMEQQIFYIFIDYRGHHWKGIESYYSAEVNLLQKHWFQLKQMYFLTIQKGYKMYKFF